MWLSGVLSLLRTRRLPLVIALTLFWSLLRTQAKALWTALRLRWSGRVRFKFVFPFVIIDFSCERMRYCFIPSTVAKREA